MSETEITVDHIFKRLDGQGILHDVHLHIPGGARIALLGPSGSGKTTLLRIIAGLDLADRGRILFDNDDVSALPVQLRRVGFVFQNYALFKHMTVAENVAFGLTVRPRHLRLSKARIQQRVAELLAMVQLEGFENRYSAQLSGGQRQRVALARALAIEPRVLLLDEPFGALDPQVRRELRRCLIDLHSQTKVTTVLVTHDQEDAFELADQVAVLHEGCIQQVAPPDLLYDKPATPFVYNFIGFANSLEGNASTEGIHLAGIVLPFENPSLLSGPVVVFIRPEDISIDVSSDLKGEILALRRRGAHICARIALLPNRNEIDVEISRDKTNAHVHIGAFVPITIRHFQVFSQTK